MVAPFPRPPEHSFMDELTDFVITIEMVKKQLTSLYTGKASGPDGIPTCVLSQAAEKLEETFTHLFRLSLDKGQLPAEWKSALVTPVQKKGDKTTASNYRPVSLTCMVCKVMEKLVQDQIMKHLQSNNKVTFIRKDNMGACQAGCQITAWGHG